MYASGLNNGALRGKETDCVIEEGFEAGVVDDGEEESRGVIAALLSHEFSESYDCQSHAAALCIHLTLHCSRQTSTHTQTHVHTQDPSESLQLHYHVGVGVLQNHGKLMGEGELAQLFSLKLIAVDEATIIFLPPYYLVSLSALILCLLHELQL